MTTGKDFWLNVGGDMGEEKNVGRGRGRFSAAGVGLDVEARLTALEDSDLRRRRQGRALATGHRRSGR